MNRGLLRSGAFVIALALALSASPVFAGGASFGDTVTDDIKLTCDLTGSGTGLIVGADDVTIDLNGYTIEGDGSGVGIDIDGYESVTVKNGTIVNFDECVLAQVVDRLKLEKLTLETVEDGVGFAAVRIDHADRVTIKRCDISIPGAPPNPGAPGAAGITMWDVTRLEVEKCTIENAFFGIGASDTFTRPGAEPTNGEINDCEIDGCFIGVLVASSTDMKIEDCEIENCNQGVRIGLYVQTVRNVKVKECHLHDNVIGVAIQSFSADFSFPFVDVETVKVEENNIHDNSAFGILADELQDSKISENEIRDNGVDGIRLLNDSQDNKIEENEVADNGANGIALISPVQQIGPSNNKIEENEVTGNGGFDCFHDEYSTPNDWDDNECDTSSGDDIDSDDD